ncbi:MAG: cyclodeaminase/cyclohydrolase family protein [Actinobacteria bacterium]|nr:cyclodeaminase/cyclohydrolase family protein [Actinomycetota bacterium]
MEAENYLELRVEDFLGRIAASEQAPGGGTAAAITVAAAAGLVAMVARCSKDSWPDAAGVAAQALQIQRRAGPLASTDAEAWNDALAALRDAGAAPTRNDASLEQKLELAAAVPLEIAQLGADVAELAVLAGERCEGSFQADAAAAAALAAGATRAALHLVQVNLGVREGDTRLERARESEQTASSAAERVLGSLR